MTRPTGLSFAGCPPYYLFQGRPTAGNEPHEVPLVRGWHIFRQAMRFGSGLARRAKFVMSHETGKVEIQAVDDRYIYLRYHRALDEANRGRFMVYHRNDEAYWLDQLEPANTDSPMFAPSPDFGVGDCADSRWRAGTTRPGGPWALAVGDTNRSRIRMRHI